MSELDVAVAADPQPERPSTDAPPPPQKRVYEAPQMKKRSVARVTLFSGGGATAGGLTAAG